MPGGPYLERENPFDPVFGFNLNRISDALTSNRVSSAVAVVNSFVESLGPFNLTANSGFTWNVIVPSLQTDTIIKTYLHFTTNTGAGITLSIDGTDRTSALGGPWGSGNISNIDATQFITTTGWHALVFTSTANTALTAYFQLQSLFNSNI